MARAASGAGSVAAPNNSLAIGLGLGGGFFLAAGLSAGLAAADLDPTPGTFICAVAAPPHNSTRVRPKISLRIDVTRS